MTDERQRETDPEKLALLYERFKDVCLVEKEVWKEIYMPPSQAAQGAVMTNVQERYDVIIDDEDIEDTLDANIPLGGKSLAAAIQEYKSHITFVKK